MSDKIKLTFLLGEKKFNYQGMFRTQDTCSSYKKLHNTTTGYGEKREHDFFQMYYKIEGKENPPEVMHPPTTTPLPALFYCGW